MPAKEATKKPATMKSAAKPVKKETEKVDFIPAVGRRKTSIARIRLMKKGTGEIRINERSVDAYFSVYEFQNMVKQPLVAVGQADAVDVTVKVIGGGLRGQSEATRQGISRALIQLNPTFRKSLKKLGYLTRDARAKERKKPGLKKARRAPQWSKR